MKNKSFNSFIALSLITLMACSQNEQSESEKTAKTSKQINTTEKSIPHNYGGWYCPDNLNGFPPVDLQKWNDVPVIIGKLPSKEEARSEASLIYVDPEKHPDATTIDIEVPQLATFNNRHTQREELIIVIQAIKVGIDSIVGFRYLNGGNGSARINEVNFTSAQNLNRFASAKFVSFSINIEANSKVIWELLTKAENAKHFQAVFDPSNRLEDDWRKTTNVNFNYSGSGLPTSHYADILFGNFYIQNDYDSLHYTEKFLLLEDKEKGFTELKIVCGPFGGNYTKQKSILEAWAQQLKALSEKQ